MGLTRAIPSISTSIGRQTDGLMPMMHFINVDLPLPLRTQKRDRFALGA